MNEEIEPKISENKENLPELEIIKEQIKKPAIESENSIKNKEDALRKEISALPEKTSPGIPRGEKKIVAGDKDVIESEWVNRAEKIIKEDKNNPYKEEEDAEDLQIEYLEKRFKKQIPKSKD